MDRHVEMNRLAGMGKTFRRYEPNQYLLLPPDLRQWLPEGHLALFVSDVVDELDLSEILDEYEKGDGRGFPPYHPVMMVKLLVYGYAIGVAPGQPSFATNLCDSAAYRSVWRQLRTPGNARNNPPPVPLPMTVEDRSLPLRRALEVDSCGQDVG